jgi:hypothetical protein
MSGSRLICVNPKVPGASPQESVRGQATGIPLIYPILDDSFFALICAAGHPSTRSWCADCPLRVCRKSTIVPNGNYSSRSPSSHISSVGSSFAKDRSQSLPARSLGRSSRDASARALQIRERTGSFMSSTKSAPCAAASVRTSRSTSGSTFAASLARIPNAWFDTIHGSACPGTTTMTVTTKGYPPDGDGRANTRYCRDDCAFSSGDRPATSGTFIIWNAGGTADVIMDFMGSYGPLTSHTCKGDCLRTSRATTACAQDGVGCGWSQTASRQFGEGVREPDLSVETPSAGGHLAYGLRVW